MKPTRPEDIFRAEKERSLTVRNSQHARLLAEAKAAFDKLMAEGQAARKSGRPRKHPLPPLKTSSSPFRPAAPAVIVQASALDAPPPVVSAPPAKTVKLKPAVSAKREGKAAGPAKAKKAAPKKAKVAKTKPKAKRSPKR